MPEDPGRAERDKDAAGREETISTLRQRSVHALEAGSSATARAGSKYTGCKSANYRYRNACLP